MEYFPTLGTAIGIVMMLAYPAAYIYLRKRDFQIEKAIPERRPGRLRKFAAFMSFMSAYSLYALAIDISLYNLAITSIMTIVTIKAIQVYFDYQISRKILILFYRNRKLSMASFIISDVLGVILIYNAIS